MKGMFVLIAVLVVSAGFAVPASAGQGSMGNHNIVLAGTDFDTNIIMPPDTGSQSKYVLGVHRPDGSRYITETYANSLDEAMTSVTNGCRDCTVDDVTNAYMPEAPEFQNYCLAGTGG